jgi:hypothetical protein
MQAMAEKGGGAELDATGKTVRVRGTLSVTSGANGQNGTFESGTEGTGGAGGAALFRAGMLAAPTITLTRAATGGALTFTIGALDATASNTTLNLTNTTAASAAITNLDVSNGR